MIAAPIALDITTLGRFAVSRHDTQIGEEHWSRRKVCELFKLLVSVEQHRLHREQIQEILWPSSASEQAANSFGKTLYLLRRILEPELITGKGSISAYVTLDRDTLMLVSECIHIDADGFESAVKTLQAKLRQQEMKQTQASDGLLLLDEFDQLLSKYAGDYLPEDLYDDWAARRRDHLRHLHCWLLEKTAELAITYNRPQRACDYLQALLAHDPSDEQAHRQLMLIYARMGQRSDALNQFQRMREVLRTELHTRPLTETTELYRAIQAGRIPVDLLQKWTPPHITTSSDGRSSLPLASDGSQPSSCSTQEREEALPLEAEASSHTQRDSQRILQATLVGREEELQLLQHAYTQASLGRLQVCCLSGEPGIGKTRLAREFACWAEEKQQAQVVWGYCHEMSGILPYQPIVDTIDAAIRSHSAEQLRQMLGHDASDLVTIAPQIQTKLSDLTQPEPLGSQADHRGHYNAVARLFSSLAIEHPLIIILDDMQWADTATLQLLSYLASQKKHTTSRMGIVPFYILLYRIDEVHSLHPLHGLLTTLSRLGCLEDVHLKRLSKQAIQQLLANITGHTVDASFTSKFYTYTEGNPFFTGEALLSLMQERHVKKEGQRWYITVGIDELALPQNVRLLIERRLISLSPDCRTTLLTAAVIGRAFSSALLCQASQVPEDVIVEHIDDAIEARILMPRQDHQGQTAPSPSQDGADLAFTHNKIREVLYRWLNPLRRRMLHRQVAQAIETLYTPYLAPYYSTLAFHYQMAEEYTRAVHYFVQAGRQAIDVYAFADAASYMENALTLLIGDADRSLRAELLHQLAADIYLYTGNTAKSVEAAEASCSLWHGLSNNVKEAEAHLDIAFALQWRGHRIASIPHIKQAMQRLEHEQHTDTTRLLARANVLWGMGATFMGEPTVAHEKLQLADELHTKAEEKDAFTAIIAVWSHSWQACLAQSPQQMLDYALHGSKVCQQMHRLDWEPMLSYTAVWAYTLLGNIAEGKRTAYEALQQAQRHNIVGTQAWVFLGLTFLALQEGQWEQIEEFSNNAFTIAEKLHNTDIQIHVLWSRSIYAGLRKDWERAIVHVAEALQVVQQEGETSKFYPYLLIQAAKAYFYANQLQRAQWYLDQGMQFMQQRGYRQLPAIGFCLQGRILQAQNKFDEAQSYFEQALNTFMALNDTVELARTQEAYSQFYLARNWEDDDVRGKLLLVTSQATFQQLGIKGG